VVEHDPIRDPAPVTSPRVRRREFGAIVVLQQRGENWTHRGSVRDAGSRGTDPPGDQ